MQGSLGKEHLLWETAPPDGRGSIGENEGGMAAVGKQCLPQYHQFCFTDEERTLEKLPDLLTAMRLVSGRARTPPAHAGWCGVQEQDPTCTRGMVRCARAGESRALALLPHDTGPAETQMAGVIYCLWSWAISFIYLAAIWR